jgi:murein DD-endopeptidase MepM/ murein hydrolase activator NlpD
MIQPLAKITDRGNDPTGFGHFGAPRGSRIHKGHDIISIPGESVVSMMEGTITKIGYAYAKAMQFRYVQVDKGIYRVWLMYLEASEGIEVGKEVCAGERVGYCLNIAKYHNRKKKKGDDMMLNHLHVQIWKNGVLIDPNIYLKKMK